MSPYNFYKTEEETRLEIDQKLEAAGWRVQDKRGNDFYRQILLGNMRLVNRSVSSMSVIVKCLLSWPECAMKRWK